MMNTYHFGPEKPQSRQHYSVMPRAMCSVSSRLHVMKAKSILYYTYRYLTPDPHWSIAGGSSALLSHLRPTKPENHVRISGTFHGLARETPRLTCVVRRRPGSVNASAKRIHRKSAATPGSEDIRSQQQPFGRDTYGAHIMAIFCSTTLQRS